MEYNKFLVTSLVHNISFFLTTITMDVIKKDRLTHF